MCIEEYKTGKCAPVSFSRSTRAKPNNRRENSSAAVRASDSSNAQPITSSNPSTDSEPSVRIPNEGSVTELLICTLSYKNAEFFLF